MYLLVHFIIPIDNIIEAIPISNIINYDYSVRISIVRVCYCTKSFLACCIENIKSNCELVNFTSLGSIVNIASWLGMAPKLS